MKNPLHGRYPDEVNHNYVKLMFDLWKDVPENKKLFIVHSSLYHQEIMRHIVRNPWYKRIEHVIGVCQSFTATKYKALFCGKILPREETRLLHSLVMNTKAKKYSSMYLLI